jgi:hypothetical protein
MPGVKRRLMEAAAGSPFAAGRPRSLSPLSDLRAGAMRLAFRMQAPRAWLDQQRRLTKALGRRVRAEQNAGRFATPARKQAFVLRP